MNNVFAPRRVEKSRFAEEGKSRSRMHVFGNVCTWVAKFDLTERVSLRLMSFDRWPVHNKPFVFYERASERHTGTNASTLVNK